MIISCQASLAPFIFLGAMLFEKCSCLEWWHMWYMAYNVPKNGETSETFHNFCSSIWNMQSPSYFQIKLWYRWRCHQCMETLYCFLSFASSDKSVNEFCCLMIIKSISCAMKCMIYILMLLHFCRNVIAFS